MYIFNLTELCLVSFSQRPSPRESFPPYQLLLDWLHALEVSWLLHSDPQQWHDEEECRGVHPWTQCRLQHSTTALWLTSDPSMMRSGVEIQSRLFHLCINSNQFLNIKIIYLLRQYLLPLWCISQHRQSLRQSQHQKCCWIAF